jgi:hypothetical protein
MSLDLRKAARFAAGGVLGFGLWWYVTPVYAELIALAARPFFLLMPTLRSCELAVAGRHLIARGGALPLANIPFDLLTYNVILFAALFATVSRIWRDRNVLLLVGGVALLAFTHAIGVVLNTIASYATQFREWSDRHFTGFEQDFWMAADYSYRLCGMFAIAFAIWYVVQEKVSAR